MVQMKFPFEIKYFGEYYSPNEIIEVEEKDTEELTSLGGRVVKESQKPKANIRKAREKK